MNKNISELLAEGRFLVDDITESVIDLIENIYEFDKDEILDYLLEIKDKLQG